MLETQEYFIDGDSLHSVINGRYENWPPTSANTARYGSTPHGRTLAMMPYLPEPVTVKMRRFIFTLPLRHGIAQKF
jgi:hypothetical protein